MPDYPGARGANQTCFCCGHFKGLMGLKANCGNHRLPPIHDRPESGCNRWAYDPAASRDIWTVEDWHVHSSKDVPGYRTAQPNAFRSPLTPVKIHELHSQHPSPATVALAWEIARLHDVLVRIQEALLELRKGKMPLSTKVHLRRLAERLIDEPGVRQAIEKAEAHDRMVHRDE